MQFGDTAFDCARRNRNFGDIVKYNRFEQMFHLYTRRHDRLQVVWMSCGLCTDTGNIINALSKDLCRIVAYFL